MSDTDTYDIPATEKGLLALLWGTGFAIAHVLIGLSGPWTPIGALFLLGLFYLVLGALFE